MRGTLITAAALGLWVQATTAAVDLNITDDNSIRRAASTLAAGLMSYYDDATPGELPPPYSYTPSIIAGLFATLIDYYRLTNDSTYNTAAAQGLMRRAGPKGDLIYGNGTNYTREMNDEQGVWALAVMAAAETQFPDPPSDQPQWLDIAKSVLDQFVSRWDEEHCRGGITLRFPGEIRGFQQKDSFSNGGFFDLAARLYRYTGNSTYGDWAKKVISWEEQAGLITDRFEVFQEIDGITVNSTACSNIDMDQLSSNAALFMHGSATMYNVTGDEFWKVRLDGLVTHATAYFAKDGVAWEPVCEPDNYAGCEDLLLHLKGFFLRWLAGTAQMAPYTADRVMAIIQSTASAAVWTCHGPNGSPFNHDGGDYAGPGDTACGYTWLSEGAYDGHVDVNSMMNALDAVMYLLIPQAKTPIVGKSGKFAKGDPSAEIAAPPNKTAGQSQSGDKANSASRGHLGSAMATVILVGCVVGGGFMVVF